MTSEEQEVCHTLKPPLKFIKKIQISLKESRKNKNITKNNNNSNLILIVKAKI